MFALISKKNANQEKKEWLIGLFGTPSDIVKQFMASGVTDAFQRLWMETCGNTGEDTLKLFALNDAGKNGTATRSTVDAINFNIGDWHYKCVASAETNAEAVELCTYLKKINISLDTVSKGRAEAYHRLINILSDCFPDVSKQEMDEVLGYVMNLNLCN